MDTSSGAVAYATGTGYLSFIKFFFICIGLKAVTDGVLRGAGDVVVFTLANLVNLGIRVSALPAVSRAWRGSRMVCHPRGLDGKLPDFPVQISDRKME